METGGIRCWRYEMAHIASIGSMCRSLSPLFPQCICCYPCDTNKATQSRASIPMIILSFSLSSFFFVSGSTWIRSVLHCLSARMYDAIWKLNAKQNYAGYHVFCSVKLCKFISRLNAIFFMYANPFGNCGHRALLTELQLIFSATIFKRAFSVMQSNILLKLNNTLLILSECMHFGIALWNVQNIQKWFHLILKCMKITQF